MARKDRKDRGLFSKPIPGTKGKLKWFVRLWYDGRERLPGRHGQLLSPDLRPRRGCCQAGRGDLAHIAAYLRVQAGHVLGHRKRACRCLAAFGDHSREAVRSPESSTPKRSHGEGVHIWQTGQQ